MSGIDLDRLPENWEIKEWNDVLEIRSGKGYKNVENPEGAFPIIGSAGKKMGFADDYICEAGTTIVGRKGNINSPMFIEERFWNVDTAFGLHVFENLYNRYLYYFCLSFNFAKLDRGSGRPSLVKSDLKKVLIPIPPLEEQKQIVEILDEAFEAIDQAQANIEKNIENAQELFQSKLNDIFSQTGGGWEEKALKEITSKIGSGSTPRGGQKSYKDEGISLIRSLNVYDDGFKPNKLAFIDDEQAKKLENVIIQEGDVLLNITGASVARCCIAPKDYLPARVNQHVSIIRIKDGDVIPSFLHYSLVSKVNKDKLLGIGEQGATRQAITKTQIQNFKINYPEDISIQNKIVGQLDSLKSKKEKVESYYQKKLSNLEDLKKSILEKAFAGELTNNQQATIN